MSKKLTKIIIAVIVVALVGAVAWLFVSGKLVWAESNTRPVVAKIVCGADTVATYNEAMYFIVRGETDQPSIDEEGVKNLKEEIKNKGGYENDPTCQTILFLTATYERDYEGAKTAAEAVKELHGKNIFADSNIRGNTPIFMYDTTVETLSPESGNSEETGASN